MNFELDYNFEEFKQWLTIAYAHREEPIVALESLYNRIEGLPDNTPEDLFVEAVEAIGYNQRYCDKDMTYILTIPKEDN